MRLKRLLDAVEGAAREDASGEEVEILNLAADSRRIETKALFVALEGSRFDGHDFLEDAVEAGAAAVLVDRGRGDEVPAGVPYATVSNTRRALGPIAADFYGHPSDDLRVIGITGTNGKTTTAHLAASIFEVAGDDVGVIGTVGHRWADEERKGDNTTPGSLELQRLLDDMVHDGVDTAVMEVSSHGIATHRLDGTQFRVGVFTNFSQDHLDFHGDLETYRAVKRSFIIEHLAAGDDDVPGVAVINVGDETGEQLYEDLEEGRPRRAYRVGAGDADLRARRESRSLDGIETTLEEAGEEYRVSLPLLGDFNVENAAGAAAAARAVGVDWNDVVDGLESVESVDGRVEVVSSADREPAVVVDYAHSPDALERVLETLRPVTEGKLVAVFGCGGDRDRDKRPTMGRVAEARADRVVVTSDNPRSEPPRDIIDDILAGIDEEHIDEGHASEAASDLSVEVDRERAIKRAIEEAEPADTVLIAGKGHETEQEFDGETRRFDDREVARRYLGGA